MTFPPYVLTALARFDAAGLEAWCVGGCVRDSLRGVTPNDYDMTTSAPPETTIALFPDYPTIPTGIAHGTVTVLVDGHPLEITTYRTDGTYTDHRRPDRVTFCSDVREDLARRDFTVNAMACHPEKGLVDPFGGQTDLQNKLIRCVGHPETRFAEDALRILRALRFAATLDYAIHPDTAAAALQLAPTLEKVARERCTQELSKLLCGPAAGAIAQAFAPVLAALFPPELAPLLPPDLTALDRVPAELPPRLAVLLSRLAPGEANALLRLWKLDNRTREAAVTILTEAAAPLPDTLPAARRLLNRLSPDLARLLPAHVSALDPALRPAAEKAEALIREASALCCRLDQLAVTGRQLRPVGVPPGKEMGAMLRLLLEEVMEGTLENQKDPLLDRARALWEQKKSLP